MYVVLEKVNELFADVGAYKKNRYKIAARAELYRDAFGMGTVM